MTGIKTTIDVPIMTRLDLNRDKIVGKMGAFTAQKIKARLRKGQDAEGRPIDKAKDPGAKAPLRRTGELIRSVKRNRVKKNSGRTTVQAKGRRSDGRINEVVMATQQKRKDQQLMGLTDAEDRQVTTTVVQKEVDRQLAKAAEKPSRGIIHRIKRLR
jgi:hypothetical protein